MLFSHLYMKWSNTVFVATIPKNNWRLLTIFFVHLYSIIWDMMNKIKQVLEEKGVKQTWLAEKLGKSLNMVNSYARNRCQPSLETLYKIADLLDVEIDDLLYSKKELAKMDR